MRKLGVFFYLLSFSLCAEFSTKIPKILISDTQRLYADSINPYKIVIIEDVLVLLNKGTNILFDFDTLLRNVNGNFVAVPVAASAVQSSREAAHIVAAISTLSTVTMPLVDQVALLKEWGFEFAPIVDPGIKAKLFAAGAQHLNGVIATTVADKEEVVKAFHQPPRVTYNLAFFNQPVFPIPAPVPTEYTTLQFVPDEY